MTHHLNRQNGQGMKDDHALRKWGDERLPKRFWTKVEVAEDGCWLWTAAKNSHGYAVFQMGKGNAAGGHRVSYVALVGPVPDGLQLDHLCRVRHCVNPVHLEPVTQKINLNRGRHHYREQTHCKNGHPKRGTGKRCLPCHAAEQARYRERKKAERG